MVRGRDMSDFMKDREREWKRAIEGDEHRVREMDQMIEQIEDDGLDSLGRPSTGQKFVRILFGYVLPVVLVSGVFIGIAKLWGWIFG